MIMRFTPNKYQNIMKFCLLVLLCIGNFVIAGDNGDYTLSLDEYGDYTLSLDKYDNLNTKLYFYGPTILNITSDESMNISVDKGLITRNYINITNYSEYYEINCDQKGYVLITITSNANNNTIAISRTEFIGCSWISINWIWLISILVTLGFPSCVGAIIGVIYIYKHRKIVSK